MNIKLMILGYARHGKDTVAEILREEHGVQFVSSSFAAAEKVMMPYFKSKGIEYASLDECYADRVNHRQEWFEQIAAYSSPDKARLAREIYAVSDAYVGIRAVEEFNAVKKEGLFDYSIWVDRSKHMPPESSVSNTITPNMANYVLDNNGTLEELRVRASNLYIDLLSLEYVGAYKKGPQ